MKKLATTLCLTIAILLESVGISWSDELGRAHGAYKQGDYALALKEFQTYAERGNSEAQYYLGVMYLKGIGLKNQKDPKSVKNILDKGIRWINTSVQQNNPDALGVLASFYERGFSLYQKDLKKAFELRTKAAETGDALSIYNLGEAVLRGLGTSQNTNDAIILFETAASKKLPTAMFNLGVIFYNEPEFKDLIKSFMWFDLVTLWDSNEDVYNLSGKFKIIREKASSNKKLIERELTKKQISSARNFSIECVHRNYKGC